MTAHSEQDLPEGLESKSVPGLSDRLDTASKKDDSSDHEGAPTPSSEETFSRQDSALKSPGEPETHVHEEKKQPRKPGSDRAFIVYDINMIRGRQILAYLQRMALPRISMSGDPKRFLEVLLNTISDPVIIYPAVITHLDSYPIVNAILKSDELEKLKDKLPHLGNIALFVVYEQDRELSRAQNMDPRYILNLKHDPAFNRTRINQVLEMLHAPEKLP